MRNPVRGEPAPDWSTELDKEVQSLRAEGKDESIFLVRLAPEPWTEVPRQATSPIEPTELEKLELSVKRREAILARGEEVVALQASFAEWVAAKGGTVLTSLWLRNELYARIPLAILSEVGEHEDVVSITTPRGRALARSGPRRSFATRCRRRI